jgi:hypothetical protein
MTTERQAATWPFDFAASLGPNCRSTWNLRNQTGQSRAYPFDWWITPSRSMLRMLAPGFHFELDPADLHVVSQPDSGETVYNARYHLLHHHDFPRDANHRHLPLTEAVIRGVREKYQALFARFQAEVAAAHRPVFVLNGTFAGWPQGLGGLAMPSDLNQPITEAELAESIRATIGSKAEVIFIVEGKPRTLRTTWGASLAFADAGSRLAPAGSEYAEPVNVFNQAYDWIRGFFSATKLPSTMKTALPPSALAATASDQRVPPAALDVCRRLYLPGHPTATHPFKKKREFSPLDFPPPASPARSS